MPHLAIGLALGFLVELVFVPLPLFLSTCRPVSAIYGLFSNPCCSPPFVNHLSFCSSEHLPIFFLKHDERIALVKDFFFLDIVAKA